MTPPRLPLQSAFRRALTPVPLATAAGCFITVAIALAGDFPIGGPPAFPRLVFGPSDTMTCAGAPVQFQTKAEPPTAAVTLAYQWQFQTPSGEWTDLVNDAEPTPQSHHIITTDENAQTSTLLINRLGTGDTGLYRCLVSASNGTALLAVPARATALAFDVGSAGGVFGGDGNLDNNDFIAFINGFFAGSNWTDLGKAGGHWGGDGLFDNNDVIAYIDLFFNQCYILHNPPEPPGVPLDPFPLAPPDTE